MSQFDKIPNNVNLSDDKRLQRALETWQPDFLAWWKEMGPEGFQGDQVYLRTAISVNPDGWANYDYVKMPDYRWGLFLAPPEQDRTIGFGDERGKAVWHDVPGELRNVLRRIIVTQADTEPASVEQQRALGHTAPSLYDLRNLFQVNVEEGRHLWAMVHLLHQFFGRDGREEAEQLLQRRSGNPDTPRILSTFNETTDDWLSFFCFTMFADRDGKYQLASLAESGFEPLSRATRFMLTEEAFHLFVGETGIERIIKKTIEHVLADPSGDARARGGIDLPTIQKYINYWFSTSVELFGGEISNNAADFFGAGLKGRYKEQSRHEDHLALAGTYRLEVPQNGKLEAQDVPLRNAMNEVLRDEYVEDCERAVRKWNRHVEAAGLSFRFALPSRRFNRKLGIYGSLSFDPAGNVISAEACAAGQAAWLPTAEDRAYVKSLMTPVLEPGQFATYISPPAKGVEGKPQDFLYVHGEGVEKYRQTAPGGDAELGGAETIMDTLRSYVREEWVAGTGEGEILVDPTTEEPLARASAVGIDRKALLAHARDVGGPALRALSFAQRGEILRALSKAIHGAREQLIELGIRNAGNTRGDAKFDIDGASGTLMAYADLGKELGDATFLADGPALPIGRSSRLAGQHFLVPRHGVAVHINAFNFPAWGLGEKLAVALLAGMPVVAKPAPATALMTVALVEKLLEAKVLPPGALSLLVGEPGDLLDHLEEQDVLAFTGSSATGAALRGHPNLLARSVKVNIEADSLNAAVLGPDVELGSETFQLFLNEVVKETTQKVGQKCTAIRRVFVPRERLAEVETALVERLSALKVGHPASETVQLGPLATAKQLASVRAGIDKLVAEPGMRAALGGSERPALEGVPDGKGYFVGPTLLVADKGDVPLVHEHEVFGPVTTLLPYDGSAAEAVRLVRLARGGLVASVYSDDRGFARDLVVGLGAFHGRLVLGSAKMAGAALGPGIVLPQFLHGGPGRAGGGEELGGVRGLGLYLQRVAVQAYGPLLDTLAPAPANADTPKPAAAGGLSGFRARLDDSKIAPFALRWPALRMATYFTLASLGSLLTLTALETVLGIDNVIFLSILVAKLPKEQQPTARRLGLLGALGMRIGLLFTLSYLAGLTQPIFTVAGRPLSGRDLVLLLGGAFLVLKSGQEIREGFHVAEEKHEDGGSKASGAFMWILLQIVVMDIVFSLDSVITAVGLGPPVPVMVTAMVLSMVIMLGFAKPIGDFVDRNPSMKVLALSFLIMIGALLVVEGAGFHVNKGYVYFAMGFSFVVDVINIQMRKARARGETAGGPVTAAVVAETGE